MSVAMAITLVMKFEIGMSNILRDYTDIANGSSSVKRNDIFMLSIESAHFDWLYFQSNHIYHIE